MTKQYVGKAMDKRYTGEAVDITYNIKRCIHAEHCVYQLAQVFDPNKRPWINANAASADEIAGVVPLCPSGALHFERKDGIVERVPTENTVKLWQDGPLQFVGDLEISGAAAAIPDETRATLCRCGASRNKPFCDNTHRDIGFEAPEAALIQIQQMEVHGGKLKITIQPNGPYQLEGDFTITNAAGEIIFSGSEAWLCRCGGSSNKPFCDDTHLNIEFQAE